MEVGAWVSIAGGKYDGKTGTITTMAAQTCKLTVGGVLTGNIKKTSLTLISAPDLTSSGGSTPPRNARGGEAKGPVAARGGGRLLATTPVRSINKELAAAGASAPVPGVQIAGGVATGMGPLHAAAALAFVALASYLINGMFSKWTVFPAVISAAIVYNQQVSVCVVGVKTRSRVSEVASTSLQPPRPSQPQRPMRAVHPVTLTISKMTVSLFSLRLSTPVLRLSPSQAKGTDSGATKQAPAKKHGVEGKGKAPQEPKIPVHAPPAPRKIPATTPKKEAKKDVVLQPQPAPPRAPKKVRSKKTVVVGPREETKEESKEETKAGSSDRETEVRMPMCMVRMPKAGSGDTSVCMVKPGVFTFPLWGDTGEPSPFQVQQGWLCNCWLICGMMLTAQHYKEELKNCIEVEDDGATFRVTLGLGRIGRHGGCGKKTTVVVDNTFYKAKGKARDHLQGAKGGALYVKERWRRGGERRPRQRNETNDLWCTI